MSNGSNQLPSLGLADKLPDIITLPQLNIPVSEVSRIFVAYILAPQLQTEEGIDDLTCIAIQYLHQLKEMFNNSPIKDFLHGLVVIVVLYIFF